jgi:Na+-transporting methylmalonyl-CoA/oxaloacetate decarboxylase gamma subunit
MEMMNGLILLLLGMGGVYIILFIMMYFMKIIIYLDSKLRFRKPAVLPAKEEILKKAATAATIHHHKMQR